MSQFTTIYQFMLQKGHIYWKIIKIICSYFLASTQQVEQWNHCACSETRNTGCLLVLPPPGSVEPES